MSDTDNTNTLDPARKNNYCPTCMRAPFLEPRVYDRVPFAELHRYAQKLGLFVRLNALIKCNTLASKDDLSDSNISFIRGVLGIDSFSAVEDKLARSLLEKLKYDMDELPDSAPIQIWKPKYHLFDHLKIWFDSNLFSFDCHDHGTSKLYGDNREEVCTFYEWFKAQGEAMLAEIQAGVQIGGEKKHTFYPYQYYKPGLYDGGGLNYFPEQLTARFNI